MLDPAGDAQHAGRKIGDHLERGPSLRFAESIQDSIKESHSDIRVVLTRFPGETIQPRQNASFANRLDVDLYISIHFFKQTTQKSLFHLFFFCIDPTTDFWSIPNTELVFLKSNEIHKQSITTSKQWTYLLFDALQSYKNIFTLSQPLGIPFKPLYGIKSPSIGIEVSLNHPEDWIRYVQPLQNSISTLIAHAKKEKGYRGIFS